MKQSCINTKYIDLNIENKDKFYNKVKYFIKKANCPEIMLDLSSFNILDAAKIMVLSSAYHYQKYPEGKVKCKVSASNQIEFLKSFITNNLELVH